jgi:hypothetical protein
MRTRRDKFILPLLTLIFAVTVGWLAFYNDSKVSDTQPSTYNTGRKGVRVAWQLLQAEHIPVGRFESPFTDLSSEVGTLFIAEPLDRPMTSAETTSLANWVHAGGTLIIVKDSVATPDEMVKLSELDAFQTPANTVLISPAITEKRVFHDVRRIYYSGDCALNLYKTNNIHVLLKHGMDVYMVEWMSQKGRVYVLSNGVGLTNDCINKADNAILMVNLSRTGAGDGEFDFDEYHHGYGFNDSGQYSLWKAIGSPARTIFWYALVVLILYIFNANRRFGAVKELVKPEERNITDYVASIASLFQRAKAAEIPVEILYHTLIQTAREKLGADPEATPEYLARIGGMQGYWDESAMLAILTRCRSIAEGEKSNEQEMLQLTKSMDEYLNKLERGRDG